MFLKKIMNQKQCQSLQALNSTLIKLKKIFLKDVVNLKDVNIENDYFKKVDGKKFVIYKDGKVIILQSEFQSKIIYENSEDIFIYRTFYSVPKCLYQILIVRVNIKDNQQYATTISLYVIVKKKNYIIKYYQR